MSIKTNFLSEMSLRKKASSVFNRLKSKNLSLKTIAALAISGTIVAGSVISVAALGVTAHITDGESVVSVLTLNKDTDNILQSAGILYGEDDVIISNVTSDRNIDITVYRPFDVKFIVDGESFTRTFNMGSVQDALDELSIDIDDNDIVSEPLDAELKENMTIEVTHRSRVTVKADGKENSILVKGGTVGAALENMGIKLNKDDICTPKASATIHDGDYITVKRVEYKEVTEKKSIPFETVTKNSDNTYIGETSITQYGVNGKKEITKRVMYVDGKKKSTEVISEKILSEPVTQVELKGTKKKQLSSGAVVQSDGTLVDHTGAKIKYTQMMSGTCTAYTATGNLTATGEVAQVGRVAVNPNIIPYGTKMYIASADGKCVYGYAVASDTGGALMDGSVLVDLYYDTVSECYEFGRRTMNVYILG